MTPLGKPKRAPVRAPVKRVGLFTNEPTLRIRRGAKRAVRRGINALGYDIQRKGAMHADFEPHLLGLCDAVAPYTMTSKERIAALANATEYVVRRGICGDFVESGVWRGGSMMAIALTLRRLGAADRRLWLYDTFATVPAPSAKDADVWGRSREEWARSAKPGGPAAEHAKRRSLEDVRSLMLSTGYDPALLSFVQGMVEETIPAKAPERIALLRLDTDWYESTRHELEHLYPRLKPGGVLIIDDYGEFLGARQAVDEYFADDPVLLNRIDFTGRIAVKMS